jgi:branched chain amino acid efflux pump
MGVAVAPALKGGRVRRALEGQTVVDASWALAIREDGRFDREFMMGATLPQFVGWFTGTAVGVALSGAIGDVRVVGFDAIFPAFFLALLVGEARRSRRAVVTALLAAAIALALLPVTPAGVPVIAASAAALLGLVRA